MPGTSVSYGTAYLLGVESAAEASLKPPRIANSPLRLRFAWSKSEDGGFVLEQSEDLSDWSPVPATSLELVEEDPRSWFYEAPVDETVYPSRFFRVSGPTPQ